MSGNNKPVFASKIISMLIIGILTIIFLLPLTGCGDSHGDNHYHRFEEVSRTPATCITEGAILKQCSCGEKKTESISALGHYYVTSSTATCIEDGIKTSKCVRCNDSTQEPEKAKGHSFGSSGICARAGCSEFKYNINLSVELPVELKRISEKYNRIYSKFQLTDLTFFVDKFFDTEYLYIQFDGKKTYDEDGAFGSEWASFMVVLQEQDSGDIVGSADVSVAGLVVGEKVSGEKEHIVKTALLEVNKKYILQIVDKKI
ncbi:MAG: hypothetical protein K2K12_05150 [Clostridia bacterium]|nr:hypothetical protein [Clostridia bacterium]